MMIVRIKLGDRAVEPVQREGDSGVDLYATHDVTVHCGQRDLVRFGVHFEIPEGYGGFVFPRSGLASNGFIVHTGVIDSGYRGEVCATLENLSNGQWWQIKRGDRVAQIVIMAVPRVTFDVVHELSDTVRGDKGFGSSGR
jgi:dUTP pyrophosphatase